MTHSESIFDVCISLHIKFFLISCHIIGNHFIFTSLGDVSRKKPLFYNKQVVSSGDVESASYTLTILGRLYKQFAVGICSS